MKVFNFLWRKLILPTTAVYTLLSIATEVFLSVLSEGVKKPALTLSACLMLFFLSLFICASTLIFYLKKLPLYLKVTLNFLATLFSIIFIVSFSSYEMEARSLALVLVYVFLYVVIAFPVIIVKTRLERKNSEEKTYTSMFEKK